MLFPNEPKRDRHRLPKKQIWNKTFGTQNAHTLSSSIANENNMSEPLKVFAFLSHERVGLQTDQELAQSYFELQELRQQLRVAECGRAISNPAPHGFVARNLH
jgi:hypothetical protein